MASNDRVSIRPFKKSPENHSAGYLFPFACFTCRKSFKRPQFQGNVDRKCPNCGGKAVMLSRKFKAPRTDDLKQWRKVQELVEAGFRFQSAMRHEGEGMYTTAKYPAELKEVAAFVAEFTPWKGGGISAKFKPLTGRAWKRPKR